VESFFFRDEAEPLYGVMHEPEGTIIRDFAMLICYPFGREYMVTHRALRTLCMNMARAGVPSMRFDYTGTGDSAGETFSFVKAVEDTVAAAKQLAEFSGMTRIKIVGLRLGASIAAMAGQQIDSTEHICLWDPVITGDIYLNELKSHAIADPDAHGLYWVNGYPLTKTLQSEIKSAGIRPQQFVNIKSAHLIFTSPNADTGQLVDSMAGQSTRLYVDDTDLDDSNRWMKADINGTFLLPYEILKRIQATLLQPD